MRETIIFVGILILCSLFISPAAAAMRKEPCPTGPGLPLPPYLLEGTWQYKPRGKADCWLAMWPRDGECYNWYNGDILIKTEKAGDIWGYCSIEETQVSSFEGSGIGIELLHPMYTLTLEYDAVHTYDDGSSSMTSHDLSKWMFGKEIAHTTVWSR